MRSSTHEPIHLYNLLKFKSIDQCSEYLNGYSFVLVQKSHDTTVYKGFRDALSITIKGEKIVKIYYKTIDSTRYFYILKDLENFQNFSIISEKSDDSCESCLLENDNYRVLCINQGSKYGLGFFSISLQPKLI